VYRTHNSTLRYSTVQRDIVTVTIAKATSSASRTFLGETEQSFQSDLALLVENVLYVLGT
jgi:hypothetical protein